MGTDFFSQIILEGNFEGVEFPVSEATTEGGHDLVEHMAYLRRGADLEPTGEQPLRGKLSIPFINDIGYGRLYPDVYTNFRRVMASNPIGVLTHPTEGIFEASLHKFRVVASPETRSGVMVEVEFVEHNGSQVLDTIITETTDSPYAAEQFANNADTLMDGVITNGQRPDGT
jgi:prophage DNA circulation protein